MDNVKLYECFPTTIYQFKSGLTNYDNNRMLRYLTISNNHPKENFILQNKTVVYEISLSVPSHLLSQHLKKFQNVLQSVINKSATMKQTELVSVKTIG